MRILPLEDRVIIERCEAERTTASGLVIPTSAAHAPKRGTVLEVGPGRMLADGTRTRMSLQVGDVVWFGDYAGDEITTGKTKLLSMREDEILGKEIDE